MKDSMRIRTARSLLTLAMLIMVALAGCSSGQSSFRIAVFSDVHFNPFYDTAIFQELLGTSEDGWAEIFEGSTVTDPQTWGEETFYPLLSQTIERVCSEAAGTPFVIFTGDILTHGFDSKFYALYGSEDETAMRAFLYKTVAFFAAQVRGYCGDVPIMPTLGNNDSYEGDYQIEPGGDFLNDTSNLFYSILLMNNADPDVFSSTWKAGGYYVTNSIAPYLSIISLNTILFSPHAASGNETATEEQLSWLEQQLAIARAFGRRVWILLHIAPGIDIFGTVSRYMDDAGHFSDAQMMWQDEYQERFLEALGEYSDIVDAIFAGHTHMDEYRLAPEDYGNWQGAIITTPAANPLFENNPEFKVLTVSGGGWKPIDYQSFNYPLESSDQSYSSYYTFSDAYGLTGILDGSLAMLYPELSTDETKKQTYINHYYSGHNDANPINDLNWPAYRCAIAWMSKEAFLQCANDNS